MLRRHSNSCPTHSCSMVLPPCFAGMNLGSRERTYAYTQAKTHINMHRHPVYICSLTDVHTPTCRQTARQADGQTHTHIRTYRHRHRPENSKCMHVFPDPRLRQNFQVSLSANSISGDRVWRNWFMLTVFPSKTRKNVDRVGRDFGRIAGNVGGITQIQLCIHAGTHCMRKVQERYALATSLP